MANVGCEEKNSVRRFRTKAWIFCASCAFSRPTRNYTPQKRSVCSVTDSWSSDRDLQIGSSFQKVAKALAELHPMHRFRQGSSMHRAVTVFLFSVLLSIGGPARLAGADLTRETVQADTLGPYAGPSERGVDTTTLSNKVMCGYQGWFNVEGDGAGRGWFHWTRRPGPLRPGNAKIAKAPTASAAPTPSCMI